VFALASLGLPGLGNFIGEFLTLVGAFGTYPWLTAVATLGLVVATVYAVALMRRVFFGPTGPALLSEDLSLRETLVLYPLVLLIVVLGLYPQPVFNTIKPTIAFVEKTGQVSLKNAAQARVSPPIVLKVGNEGTAQRESDRRRP
jgi:NADH-quinone oxidoreductase subunit M